MTVPVSCRADVAGEGHVAGREAGDRLAEDDREVDRAVLVGSAWAAAWLMVTVGRDVVPGHGVVGAGRGGVGVARGVVATPAAIDAMTVPALVMPVTATL